MVFCGVKKPFPKILRTLTGAFDRGQPCFFEVFYDTAPQWGGLEFSASHLVVNSQSEFEIIKKFSEIA